MKKIQLLFRYVRYLIASTNQHGIHSPFVFDLVTTVIYDEKNFYGFKKINAIRERLLQDETLIPIRDLGAGSLSDNGSKKAVKDITQQAAKTKKQGELLFRLVNKFAPKTVLELGTSLGISGMYLASACKNARFITIEGNQHIAGIAAQNFKEIELKNTEQLIGKFEDELPKAIQQLTTLDFVFFDGNHRKEPTLEYFRECIKHTTNQSIFIFDDIHWSEEMETAWHEIKNDERVTVTIDLFFMGIVFFRKEQIKQHFVIRY